MDDLAQYDLIRHPTRARPLLGLTVLVVEDSRFACDAMRLLCIKSGARIRRADCLRSARRHLQVYRPSVVVIDLGLPDGSGADLISELSETSPRVDVILATSGDEFGEAVAIAAGADGFMPKPLSSVAAFQQAILTRMPEDRRPDGLRSMTDEIIQPDQMAFRDDMAHVADVLDDEADDRMLDYVAQFLTGVARSADDTPLLNAAQSLAKSRSQGGCARSDAARVAGLVQDRLAQQVAI